jgi:hypothetical protein
VVTPVGPDRTEPRVPFGADGAPVGAEVDREYGDDDGDEGDEPGADGDEGAESGPVGRESCAGRRSGETAVAGVAGCRPSVPGGGAAPATRPQTVQ